MSNENRDIGFGIQHTFNQHGHAIACYTVTGHCAGCVKPLVRGVDQHDGPSGSGRKWEIDIIAQWEKDRIKRIRWELNESWPAFDEKVAWGVEGRENEGKTRCYGLLA